MLGQRYIEYTILYNTGTLEIHWMYEKHPTMNRDCDIHGDPLKQKLLPLHNLSKY